MNALNWEAHLVQILVVGSTGVLGRHVIPRLIERKHQVRALVRGDAQALMWRRLGADPVMGDIFDAASLERASLGCDAALHLATAIPKPGRQEAHARDWSLNDRIRREGTRTLLGAVARAGVRRYVQQSITLVYGDCGAEIVDESRPAKPTAVAASAADMERMVQESDLDWCILRGGALYGPDTGREDEWFMLARDAALQLPGDGEALLSLIHVVDFARAIVAAAETAQAGGIYNVVDDVPVTYRDLFGYVAGMHGMPDPAPGGPLHLPSLGCSNARLRDDLRWSPVFPSYRSGLIR